MPQRLSLSYLNTELPNQERPATTTA